MYAFNGRWAAVGSGFNICWHQKHNLILQILILIGNINLTWHSADISQGLTVPFNSFKLDPMSNSITPCHLKFITTRY